MIYSTHVHCSYFIGNVDFNETQATITFPNGTQGGARVPFSVPIIDDNIAEYNEYFIISSRVRGSGIGVFTRLSYDRYILIRDNDRKLILFSTYYHHRLSCIPLSR